MYKDYIFDLYGTLLEIRTDEENSLLWEGIAGEYGSQGIISDPILLKKEYGRLVKKEIKAMGKNRKFEPEIALEKVFAALFPGGYIDPKDELIYNLGRRFRELSTLYIYPYEGVDRLLGAIRNNKGRVFLLSNAQRIFTEYEIKRFDLDRFFDGIYISSDYGVKKPDPAFYNILIKDQHINPTEAVMIGNDGVCDIDGARAVGLHAIYIKSATSPDNYHNNADVTLDKPDMAALEKLLL